MGTTAREREREREEVTQMRTLDFVIRRNESNEYKPLHSIYVM